MATTLLELLSQPIVDEDRNASTYFEDAWYQLIEAIGGEGVDLSASVDALTVRVTQNENDIDTNEAAISGNTSSISSLSDQDLEALFASLMGRINNLESIIEDLIRDTPILNNSGLIDRIESLEAQI